MRITLCGRVSIVGEAAAPVTITRSQVQLCLAVLTAERHREVTSEELADALWPSGLSDHWHGAQRGVLTKLRRAFEEAGIGADALSRAGGGLLHLRLPEDVDVDVERAGRQVRAAEAGLRNAVAHEARNAAEAALDVLGHRYLPAVDAPWADARRFELDQLRRRAQRILARTHLGTGRPALAIEIIHQLLATDPLDDDGQLLLARTLAATGERVRAIAALDRYAALLTAELGVGPAPDHAELRRTLASTRSDPGRDRGRDPRAEHATPRPSGGGAVADEEPRTLFGRHRERRALSRVLADPGPSGPDGLRVVTVEGEAGIGKTALVEQVAAEARQAGRLVLWGSCSPYGTIPFQPIAEALAGAIVDPTWGPRLAGAGAGLRPLVGSTDWPASEGPSRLGLFRATAAATRQLVTTPALWVVDDAHWATPDTLDLLVHLCEAGADLPLTLVLTQRHPTPGVATMLSLVARTAAMEGVELRGLDQAAVSDWVHIAGLPASDDWVDQLRERTGGNPLFIRHLVAAARECGLDAPAAPPELRTLIEQRLAALSEEAALLLSVAGVVGSPAPLTVLSAVSGLFDAPLLTALDELTRGGLMHERVDGAHFTHGLVEEATVERLGDAQRAWFHRRAAAVLEVQPSRTGAAADVARHHLAAGGPHGDEVRRWSVVAGRQALSGAAWAAAAHHAENALAASSAAVDERVDALLVLARAQRGLGDHERARAALAQALDLARVHRLPRHLAQTTLEVVGGGGRGIPDDARFRKVTLVEDALEALGEHDADDDLRIPLLGALTVALLLTDRDAERRQAAKQALTRARRHGNPVLLAGALLDQRFGDDPAAVTARIAATEESLALAEANDRADVAVAAQVYRLEDAIRTGDQATARVAAARTEAILDRHPDPYWTWSLRTWAALGRVLDGDLDSAEREATAAYEAAADRTDAFACFGVNLVMVRMLQGRAAEVVAPLEAAARDNPAVPCYRAVLAFAAAEAGLADRARAELGAFIDGDRVSVPHDTNHLLTLTMLAETMVRLDDRSHARCIATGLEPYAGQHVVLNCYGGGGAVWGPVSAHLGALARLCGDTNAARHWLHQAREEAYRSGDRLFLARLEPTAGEL